MKTAQHIFWWEGGDKTESGMSAGMKVSGDGPSCVVIVGDDFIVPEIMMSGIQDHRRDCLRKKKPALDE